MSEVAEIEYVEYHDCKVLGNNTRLIRALMADKDGDYILCYQYKCPFCSLTRGDKVPAKGVTINADGTYTVDTSIAEKLHNDK